MGKDYKKQFKEDVNLFLQSNLNFDQIRDKIIMSDEQKEKNIKGKEFYNTNTHTHNKNRGFLSRWKVLSAAAASTFLIFALTFTYFSTLKKPDYKLSQFNTQLQGVVYGKQSLNNFKPVTLSELIDAQYNSSNPTHFYEIDVIKKDNFYTCAYFPTKYYDNIFDVAISYSKSYIYSNESNIIDGKLIAAYQDYYTLNQLTDKDNVKWYQVSKGKEIPLHIKDYTLGLVLGSQDILFKTNKTINKPVNITKKIFYRDFFDINTLTFDNTANPQAFLNDINDANLIATNNLIISNSYEEIIVKNCCKIVDAKLSIMEIDSNVQDCIGKYNDQLQTIKLEEIKENDIAYGIYDYEKFCDMFLNINKEPE